ncbi:hypothetical protein J1C54_13695 [Alcanivorax sp. 1008]|nr:hypothetical protein [Alcanivorax sp. 1008]
MPANTDLRTIQMVHAVPRSAFVSSSDISELMSGHSIPSQAAVRSILSRIPPLRASDKVLLIGAGSGYFAMILSRLVAELVVVEHNQVIADIAGKNLAAFKPANLTVRVSEGESGAADLAPFDRVIALCELTKIDTLLEQLVTEGSLVMLGRGDGHWTSLELCERDAQGNVRRQDLGPVDFSSDIGAALMDMGLVDEHLMATAKEEADRLSLPLMTVVQRHLGAEDISVYRAVAKRLGITFEEADKLFPQIDRSLVRQFSRTFLDHYRMIPIAQKGDCLQVASDNPEIQTVSLEAMMPGRAVQRILVTPTDYRRLWSAINISDKGARAIAQAAPSAQSAAHEDFAEELDNHISPYLVAVYEAILLDAVSEKASDIHIERYHQRVRVRLRVDGELSDLNHYQLTPAEMAGVINVIKTRAELNIAERRLP